jgi:hypothetical protein
LRASRMRRSWLVMSALAVALTACGSSGGAEVALPAPNPGTLDFEKFDGGWRLQLDADLERRDGGEYYEAFLEGSDGRVSVGTFNEADDVVLWAGVSPETHPEFVINEQPGDVEVLRVDASSAADG